MKDLVDALADLEHCQWWRWAEAVESEVDEHRRVRWLSYMKPYASLPEDVKEKDREWARQVLKVIDEAGYKVVRKDASSE